MKEHEVSCGCDGVRTKEGKEERERERKKEEIDLRTSRSYLVAVLISVRMLSNANFATPALESMTL